MTNTSITTLVTFEINTKEGLFNYITHMARDKEIIKAIRYYIQDDKSASNFCKLWNGEIDTVDDVIKSMMESLYDTCRFN